MGGEEDSLRLSRLGRLPPSSKPDLSLPTWNELPRIPISPANNSLDTIHTKVDRNCPSEEFGRNNAFLQAQLAAERIAVAKQRRENLQRKTEQRSKAALTELQKQNTSNPKPKLPWSRAQPKQKKFKPRLGVGLDLYQSSPLLERQEEVVLMLSPKAASTAERQLGKENHSALDVDSIDSSPLSPTLPRSPRNAHSGQQVESIGSLPSRQEVRQSPGAGRDVLFQPSPEQPEIEDVASELVESSEFMDAGSDDRNEDSDTSDHLQEELLLPGEMSDLTIRDGIVDVQAEESGEAEIQVETAESHEKLPWMHPLRDLPTPQDFDSSIQLVSTAGQRARMNLARYASKSALRQESTWHDEQDDVLAERKASPINQQSPFRTVVHKRASRSDDESDEQTEPTPRQKTPEPTRRTTGLREELHKKDPGAAAFPLKMKNRPAWWASSRATYEARAKRAGITLPSLCNCSTAAPLDPNYPALCSRNCPLYKNPVAWEAMVHSLLQTYQLLLA